MGKGGFRLVSAKARGRNGCCMSRCCVFVMCSFLLSNIWRFNQKKNKLPGMAINGFLVKSTTLWVMKRISHLPFISSYSYNFTTNLQSSLVPYLSQYHQYHHHCYTCHSQRYISNSLIHQQSCPLCKDQIQ